MDDFKTFWQENYGEIAPVGYRLRNRFIDSRWVRFHSLPESKRYADNEAEMETLLDRANTLADHVLGIGTDCWMIANSYPNQAEHLAKISPKQRLIRDIFGLRKSYSWKDPDEAPEDQILWTTYAGECRWRHGAFDEAIKIIAEDIETNVLWVSKRTKAVFSPYDGGTDLIVQNSKDVISLKEKFSDWLSAHPDGF
jgi:hypothetical protein